MKALIVLFVVIPGIIAALICFRWVRMVAIVFVLFTLWWFASVHAEQDQIMQCRIGSWSQQIPLSACDAMKMGGRKLEAFNAGPLTKEEVQSCGDEASRYANVPIEYLLGTCTSLWHAMQSDIVRLDRQNPSFPCLVNHRDGQSEEFRASPSECQRRIEAAEHEN